jgi:hypothetical protein
MKTKICYYLIATATFLAPAKGLIILVFLSVLLDTSYKIYAVIKLKGVKALESDKFFNIVVKLFFYLGTMIMAYLVDTYIMDGKLYGIEILITKIMSVVWVLTEVKSLDETNQELGNKPFLELVTAFIKVIKSLKKDLRDIISK